MKLLRLALTKAPKVVLAAGIFGITTAIFLLWLVMRGGGGSGNGAAQVGRAENGAPTAIMPEFIPDEVVLCGNTLLDFRSGRILAKQWLEDFGDTAPPIVKVLPTEKLVICGNRGFSQGFGFDGKAKPPIALDGKAIGPAGFSFGDSRVLFIREGNIWLGRVDWLQSTVNGAKRITDTGYFREDSFRGDWFSHGEILFIPVLGRTHRVDLLTGSVSQDAANIGAISHGLSPDGNKAAVAFGHGSFLVVDFATGEGKQFSMHGNFREFLWLDENRLAYASSQNEISVLDARTGKVTACSAPAAVLKLAAASPQGESVMVGTSTGPMVFSTDSGKFLPVNFPMDDGVWISESLLLCTNSSTDTAFRGIWRVDAESGRERISNQPVDSISAATGARPMLPVPGGAVWVSGGNLWRYDPESKAVSQVTQNQHLSPSLQILQ